jgi:hypothetical protein
MTCPRCGEPLRSSTAFLTGADTCTALPLPPVCTSDECRSAQRAASRAREADVIAAAIERGVIDP